MSEDRRKNARTQGRFSGGDREGNSRWHDKQNSKTTSADKNKGEKRKAPVVGSRAQNEIDLQFEEDSNYKFKELETPGKPQELKNGKDSVAWHSDDEFTLGVCPTIASVSLGETRKFEMRPKRNVENVNTSDILFVNLTHGSLIVMDGCMQKDWQHRVPKEYHDKGERINLTFRTIYPIDQLPPEMPYVSNMKSAKTPSAKVDHQQDHKFDAESFPPLGMEVNDKKNKCLPKENYNKDYQQSVKQRKHQKEENWDDEMFQNVEGMEEASKSEKFN
ncbi:Alpha-ketoglutarate-dependent dioxygenase like protein [Argiope bruennichi]|uniref:Alpha-ketoglutarate-dependent dioxygenase like protein n=1 Tax=Argiope bruennichi TaxID=94029 RepID=A0A8T0EGA1_ARGBR|nr:Alpha-ketoglutarate-dependent dioxygenase like protein [Argiope bruennichi]